MFQSLYYAVILACIAVLFNDVVYGGNIASSMDTSHENGPFVVTFRMKHLRDLGFCAGSVVTIGANGPSRKTVITTSECVDKIQENLINVEALFPSGRTSSIKALEPVPQYHIGLVTLRESADGAIAVADSDDHGEGGLAVRFTQRYQGFKVIEDPVSIAPLEECSRTKRFNAQLMLCIADDAKASARLPGSPYLSATSDTRILLGLYIGFADVHRRAHIFLDLDVVAGVMDWRRQRTRKGKGPGAQRSRAQQHSDPGPSEQVPSKKRQPPTLTEEMKGMSLSIAEPTDS